MKKQAKNKQALSVIKEKQKQSRQSKVKQQALIAAETINTILAVKNMGKAAQLLGISRQTLWERVKRYNIDELLKNVTLQAEQELKLHAPDAVETLANLMYGARSEFAKLEASKDILDRAGVTKKQPQTQINIASKDMNIEFVSNDNNDNV